MTEGLISGRDRMIAALTHRECDRIPIIEEIWPTTQTRWVNEGLPADVPFARHLGIEEFLCFGIDDSFGFPVRVEEETAQHSFRWDANGALVQSRLDGVSTPHVVRATINSPARWAEHREQLVFSDRRIHWEQVRTVTEDAVQRGHFMHYNMSLGYERWSGIVGSEALLVALVESPGWIREMHEADVELNLASAEELLGRGIHFDAARFSADMGYSKGPLFSPRTYREVFMPGLARLCGFFHAHGIYCILHSCGNVRLLIPDLIATGFDCLNPLEVKAGMDLLTLKRDFGEVLCLMGGIDAPGMAGPADKVENDIREKLTLARRGGGYIFHSDHAVPETVSLEQFTRVVGWAKQYGCQLETGF
jgi:uroporphyrinogen decarboxylase